MFKKYVAKSSWPRGADELGLMSESHIWSPLQPGCWTLSFLSKCPLELPSIAVSWALTRWEKSALQCTQGSTMTRSPRSWHETLGRCLRHGSTSLQGPGSPVFPHPGRSPSGKEFLSFQSEFSLSPGLSPWGKAPCLLLTSFCPVSRPQTSSSEGLFPLPDHTFT